MIEPTPKTRWENLNRMKSIIDQTEKLLLDLNALGGEMPVVEKNVRAMMSFIHVLKLAISDLAELGGE
jgi:hypothetical protein